MISRRDFLRAGTAGLALLAIPGSGRVARAATSRNVLVVVYLRGGADGLSLVAPYGDPEYASLRPTLSLPQNQLNVLDGFFGMHGNLGELAALYGSNELSVVHCSGLTYETRSHFDAQDFMERAAPGDKSVTDGWLNRYLALRGQDSALAGVSIGWSDEAALAGPAASLSLTSLSRFSVSGPFPEERKATMQAMHSQHPNSLLSTKFSDMLATEELLTSVSTDTSVEYPDNSFGRQLRDLAALIRADVGLHVGALSLGGWDHHDDQTGQFENSAARLSTGLGAFYQDLGGDANRVLTLVMTEFGRTVEENGTFGTDHGRGSAMMALGGGVAGGNVLLKNGTWPGLTPNQGWPRRDLDVTTDFRDVFAEVLARHLGLGGAQLSSIFPDFTPAAQNYPGLFV